MSRPRVRDLVRFARQYVVDAESGCWLWQGYLGVGGYGMFALARPKPLRHRTVPAHRASYLLHVGAIPKGMDLDHLCRVRHCVNPAHLEPVTERENAMRGDTLAAANAAKTHCPAGHPYDEENTAGRARGVRECRTCGREATRRWRAQHKAHRAAYMRRKRAERTPAERQKDRARAMIRGLVAEGALVKPELCEACGSEGRLEAHHEDYGRPLDVRWLCGDCHRAEHRDKEDGRSRIAA